MMTVPEEFLHLYERMYTAHATLLLDADVMIRRVGVPIDWASLPRFVDDPAELNADFWKTCKQKSDPATAILNLTNVRGDISSLKPLVEQGVVELWVLSNWNIDADDFATLKALDMPERVGAILGAKEPLKCYGREEPRPIVMAIGPELTRHVQALQLKKKVRA